PQAQFEPALGEQVERRRFLREDRRMPVVVAEDEGPDAQRRRGVGGRHQRRDRAELVIEVIGDRQAVKAKVFDPAGELAPGVGGDLRRRRGLDTETERTWGGGHSSPRWGGDILAPDRPSSYGGTMADRDLYLHELVDIVGQGQYDYMEHA